MPNPLLDALAMARTVGWMRQQIVKPDKTEAGRPLQRDFRLLAARSDPQAPQQLFHMLSMARNLGVRLEGGDQEYTSYNPLLNRILLSQDASTPTDVYHELAHAEQTRQHGISGVLLDRLKSLKTVAFEGYDALYDRPGNFENEATKRSGQMFWEGLGDPRYNDVLSILLGSRSEESSRVK